MTNREINTAIAIKLFGFKWRESTQNKLCAVFPPDMQKDSKTFKLIDEPKAKFGDYDCYVPEYSTDISDAFLVVAEMKRRGFDYSFCSKTVFMMNDDKVLHYAEFRQDADCPPYFGDSAETLPLAICRAVLNYLEK